MCGREPTNTDEWKDRDVTRGARPPSCPWSWRSAERVAERIGLEKMEAAGDCRCLLPDRVVPCTPARTGRSSAYAESEHGTAFRP